jgi:DNA-binding CsgD family transcriptional regulator
VPSWWSSTYRMSTDQVLVPPDRGEGHRLRLLAEGRTDREIAAALFLGHRTVHHHVANLLAKLGVHTRAGATRFALAAGLAGPDPPLPT